MPSIGYRALSFFTVPVANDPDWLPLSSLSSPFRSPIPLIGDRPLSFFTISIVNDPYWRKSPLLLFGIKQKEHHHPLAFTFATIQQY
jgi:hypothetical protein